MRAVSLALSAALLWVSALAAQGASPIPPRLTIAQLQYDGGGDWYANPSGLPNLLDAIRTRTGLPVETGPAQIRLTDPALRRYPYLFVTGHGNMKLSAEEVGLLRRYLDEGGFMHVDDNYGLDESFRRELARVYPEAELSEIPAGHPVYDVFYEFPDGLPKIHEHDGEPAKGLGLFHDGRLVVFYSYQTDLGDGWENADVHDDPPEAREAALRMGVNLFLYAVSQVAP